MENEPKIIIGEVERLSSGKLNFGNDLEKLIETAFTHGKMPLLEKISFNAKFLNGLFGVINKKNDTIDPQYFEKAIREYQDGIQRIKVLLDELLASTTEFYRSIFMEKFLSMTQLGLENLNFLCSDLSYLKLYFNDQRK